MPISQTSQTSQTRSQQSTSSRIPQTAAVGVLSVTQPPQTATSFYKIASGQLITFAWNFTSVLATPTHLTVSAVCDNGNTYPVGPTDGIIAGTATSVVWDPYGYDQLNPNTPLAQASYSLRIWDDRGPNPPLQPGHLQPNSAVRFALYTPQGYTPLTSGEFFYFMHPLLFNIPTRLDMSRLLRIHINLHSTSRLCRHRCNIPYHVSVWLQHSTTYRLVADSTVVPVYHYECGVQLGHACAGCCVIQSYIATTHMHFFLLVQTLVLITFKICLGSFPSELGCNS
jgi:hypothetical protein